MRTTEIREKVHETPFRPLRIFISNGSFYDVPHPEFVFVTLRSLYIGQSFREDMMPRRSVYIDPMHVTHIERLEDDDQLLDQGR